MLMLNLRMVPAISLNIGGQRSNLHHLSPPLPIMSGSHIFNIRLHFGDCPARAFHRRKKEKKKCSAATKGFEG